MCSGCFARWREHQFNPAAAAGRNIINIGSHQQGQAMSKQIVSTPAAPAAIGPYSQAVRSGNTLWLSGQIPLDPLSKELVAGDIEVQARRVFDNIKAVIAAAGGSVDDVVKTTIFLVDLAHFAQVNKVMAEYFREPYPARSTVGVAALPRGAQVEVECIVAL
jgi:reactive intermediate/imine deaminase